MTFTDKWATRPHVRYGDPCYACGIGMAPGTPMWARKNGLIPDDMRQHGGLGLCTTCASRRRAGLLDPDNPTPPTRRVGRPRGEWIPADDMRTYRGGLWHRRCGGYLKIAQGGGVVCRRCEGWHCA